MTTVEASAPHRNWGAVLLVIAGGFAVAMIGADAISLPSSGSSPTVFADFLAPFSQFGLFVAPIVAFIPIAFGSRRLLPIAGPRLGGKWLVFLPPVVVLVCALVQFVAQTVASFSDYDAYEPSAYVPVNVISGIFIAIALFFGVFAGVQIVRARVAGGLARWSMLVAAILVAVSMLANAVVANYIAATLSDYVDANSYNSWNNATSALTEWALIPAAFAVLGLGLSYWRVGTIAAARPSAPVRRPGPGAALVSFNRPPAIPEPIQVPAAPKSLAE